MEKKDIIIILNKDNNHIILKSTCHILGKKINIFSIANTIDAVIFFYFNEVKFISNIKK